MVCKLLCCLSSLISVSVAAKRLASLSEAVLAENLQRAQQPVEMVENQAGAAQQTDTSNEQKDFMDYLAKDIDNLSQKADNTWPWDKIDKAAPTKNAQVPSDAASTSTSVPTSIRIQPVESITATTTSPIIVSFPPPSTTAESSATSTTAGKTLIQQMSSEVSDSLTLLNSLKTNLDTGDVMAAKLVVEQVRVMLTLMSLQLVQMDIASAAAESGTIATAPDATIATTTDGTVAATPDGGSSNGGWPWAVASTTQSDNAQSTTSSSAWNWWPWPQAAGTEAPPKDDAIRWQTTPSYMPFPSTTLPSSGSAASTSASWVPAPTQAPIWSTSADPLWDSSISSETTTPTTTTTEQAGQLSDQVRKLLDRIFNEMKDIKLPEA